MSDMLHNKRRKSKGENYGDSKIYMQQMMHRERVIFRLSFAVFHLSFSETRALLITMENEKW
jgi:hypothetical protein